MAAHTTPSKDIACGKDAWFPDVCLCGNCNDEAIKNTCLRYSKDDEGNWYLAACRPSLDCDKTFPASARRPGDTVFSCPCSTSPPHAAPVAPAPIAAAATPPSSRPCNPPAKPSVLRRIWNVLTGLLAICGVIALAYLAWALYKRHSDALVLGPSAGDSMLPASLPSPPLPVPPVASSPDPQDMTSSLPPP